MSFVQARRVASLSWPLYLGSAVLVIVAVALMPFIASAVLRWIVCAFIVGTVAIAVASFWAFHLMFDKSELLGGTWLKNAVALPPERWVQITTALEQTTLPIESVFPAAQGEMIDIYDPGSMTEPALTRARQASGAGRSVRIESIEDASADLVVVMLAAHEIRKREGRQRLFNEVARVLSNRGCLVLVEHLRNHAAALAFGPGMLHFFPRREWLALTDSAGLRLTREFPITPFVRVFVFQPIARGGKLTR